ncbi:hypothetical protein Tco_1438312 [Tanacetum coccineum]
MTLQRLIGSYSVQSVREGNDLILVQIYVDDIIFAASTPELYFSKSQRASSINKSKYLLSHLKNMAMNLVTQFDTPMGDEVQMMRNKEGKSVDPSHYRGMIGTPFNLQPVVLTTFANLHSVPGIRLGLPEKAPNAVKRTLVSKGTVHPWSLCITEGFLPLHYPSVRWRIKPGCQDTRRSTSGSIQLLGDRLVSWSSKRQKSAAISSIS